MGQRNGAEVKTITAGHLRKTNSVGEQKMIMTLMHGHRARILIILNGNGNKVMILSTHSPKIRGGCLELLIPLGILVTTSGLRERNGAGVVIKSSEGGVGGMLVNGRETRGGIGLITTPTTTRKTLVRKNSKVTTAGNRGEGPTLNDHRLTILLQNLSLRKTIVLGNLLHPGGVIIRTLVEAGTTPTTTILTTIDRGSRVNGNTKIVIRAEKTRNKIREDSRNRNRIGGMMIRIPTSL